VFAVLPMDLKRAMASNVRRERYARGLTQEDLADRAGLSARYLGSIERETVSASVTVLGRLSAGSSDRSMRLNPQSSASIDGGGPLNSALLAALSSDA
jgi:transcriptional regulator with XRE-family HTH domain